MEQTFGSQDRTQDLFLRILGLVLLELPSRGEDIGIWGLTLYCRSATQLLRLRPRSCCSCVAKGPHLKN